MPTPPENDPALARFRRGAGTRVDPPGPPPVLRAGEHDAGGPERAPEAFEPPTAGPQIPSDWAASGSPLPAGTVPGGAGPTDPGAGFPLFSDLVGGLVGAPAPNGVGGVEPEGQWPQEGWSENAWPGGDWQRPPAAPGVDPGRNSGIVAIVVGIFAGLIGLIVGIFSVRSSHRAGLAGRFGIVGIVVSLLSLVVVSSIGISYARYEASLAHQCALVGPGDYLTPSGDQVTCR
jgi:hypothetical protein